MGEKNVVLFHRLLDKNDITVAPTYDSIEIECRPDSGQLQSAMATSDSSARAACLLFLIGSSFRFGHACDRPPHFPDWIYSENHALLY
jgi:hypothetical protein